MDFPDYMEQVLNNCEQIGLPQLSNHYKTEDISKEFFGFIFGYWNIGHTPEICAKTLYRVFEEIHVEKMNERKMGLGES